MTLFFESGQGLQGEHLAPCLWPDGDAVGDGVSQQLIHRIFAHDIRGQVAILGIPFHQTLPFQKAADSVGNGVCQLCEFLAGRRFNPTEPH